ncbi:hypothetical protein Cpir12675_000916 [Ceratocystis pirilliformis]|uniref:HMA domain-containing protein n=1 Tax=Ceratocystis pirilliformis TaxID=259994 RepID=A0ABR3ZJX0_9PEZI
MKSLFKSFKANSAGVAKLGRSSTEAQSQKKPFLRSSLLLENLHCPSCVTAIKIALQDEFESDILWVSPNIVTSVVVVEHYETRKTNLRRIVDILEDCGFEIGAVQTAPGDSTVSRALTGESLSGDTNESTSGRQIGDSSALSERRQYLPSRPPPPERRTAHLDNCEACRTSGDHKDSPPCHPADNGRSPNKKVKSSLDLLVSVKATEPRESSWRVTLAIGGMTCAVCVNTITNELKKREFIENASVALVSNSATVVIADESYKQTVVNAIEDLGYDATVDSVERISPHNESPDRKLLTNIRTVEIRVDGMFCQHCPGRLKQALGGFGDRRLRILEMPTIDHAILQVKYTPEAPTFTVRHILSAIEAADPAFTASIYHPPTLEERSKQMVAKHQRELLQRTVLSMAIAVPTFVLGIVYMSLIPDSNHAKMFLMHPWTSGISRLQIILFALATPVYFYGADIFHLRTFKEICTLWRPGSRTPIPQRFYRFGSMNMLISLGTTIAYFSSIAQMIDAGIHKPHMVEDNQFYFDSVVFLTMFLLLGRLIESYSKSRTGDAIEMLIKLRPSTALLVNKGSEGDVPDTIVSADLLEFGDIVRVPHGASPPADGLIVSGATSFDESSLTGESHLVKKAVNEPVYAGTVNKDGAVLVKITSTAGVSMLDQIVKVVREGQAKRAPMEHIADLLTMYFVPVIVLIAVSTWLIWMSLGLSGAIPKSYLDHRNDWVAFALQFAVAVFVVACPCGLALAAPTAIFVGGGIAAQYGILAKGGGEAFQKASKIDCVVFDKTGTLTEGGEPRITDSVVYPGMETNSTRDATLIASIKAVEQNSNHPVAIAVLAFCQGYENGSLPQVEIGSLSEVPGRGMKATCKILDEEPLELIIGNEAMMGDHNVTIPALVSESITGWKLRANSIALAAVSTDSLVWTFVAGFAIADPIRKEAVSVVKALRMQGTQVWMLSGDNATTASAVARMVGIEENHVLAEVLPSQKAEKVAYLQRTLGAVTSRKGKSDNQSGRGRVAMVGDGINDSPALTQADIGIAIGSGSDIAISSADFVLVTSDLRSVHTLLHLSQAVFRRIKFNFGWACVFNLVAVPIAAGVLYPIVVNGTRVRLDPVWAALAMALSSISVVMSSLLLRSRMPLVGYQAKMIPE